MAAPERSSRSKGHLYQMITRLRARIEELESRIHHLERQANTGHIHASGHEHSREIVRTPRGANRYQSHRARRMHNEGRRMGRMMHRAWRDRQPEA